MLYLYFICFIRILFDFIRILFVVICIYAYVICFYVNSKLFAPEYLAAGAVFSPEKASFEILDMHLCVFYDFR